MRVESFDGYLLAESPIHHGGDEKTGSEALVRRMSYLVDGKRVQVPVISGNSIRGVLRRLVMGDMLSQLGYRLENLKVYHMLFAGGTLESVSTSDSGNINLEMRKKYRQMLPPLSLFGTAIGNQMIEGKMRCGIALPVCRELRDFLPRDYENRIKFPFNEQLAFDFITRRDDLQSGRSDDGEDARAQQMLVNFEVIVPGTVLYHNFTLNDASSVERGVLARALNLWRSNPYIGGKSGVGYGRVKICYELNDDSEYMNFISENKDSMLATIREIEGLM